MNERDELLIDQYLRGELSEERSAAFESRLEQDPELQEKLHFEQELFESLNENDWSFLDSNHARVKEYEIDFKSEKAQQLKASILQASQNYHSGAGEETKVRSMWPWYTAVAAAIALVITFYVIATGGTTNQSLYTDYLAQTDLPDLASRGGVADAETLAKAQALFDQQDYTEAEKLYTQLLSDNVEMAGLYINLALSQVALQKEQEALSTLNALISSNLLDAEKGYWFKALALLNFDREEEASTVLNQIVDQQRYNAALAKALLEELE